MFLDRVRGFYLRDTQPLAALQVWQEYRENEDLLDRIWDRLQVVPKSLRRSSPRATLARSLADKVFNPRDPIAASNTYARSSNSVIVSTLLQ
jgi:hypothetical protein